MSYPFVQSFHDAGKRAGPIRGFTVHMAEGGGTVGFLAKRNPNGVSVHYVIERSGRIVQMLLESHMHTSIRIGTNGDAIRQADDEDGFYGVSAARGVLGDWYDVRKTLGPNHATIAVEIEGFAAVGPNPDQEKALIRLTNDIRSRHPGIGLLGHRDHNVKACPGRRIPWPEMGGHGPASEEPVAGLAFTMTDPTPGRIKVKNIQGVMALQLADREAFPFPPGAERDTFGLGRCDENIGGSGSPLGYLIGDELAVIPAGQVDFTPDTLDCSGPVGAQRERDRAAVLAAVEEVYAA